MDRTHAPRSAIRWGCCAALAATLTVTAVATAPDGGATPRPPVPHVGWSAGRWGDPVADRIAQDVSGRNAASADPGSLYTVETAIGARKAWLRKDAQGRLTTGQGVSVALLDSGTAAVPGLAGRRLMYGPDLSAEANGLPSDLDTYGHGTFMAGLIAANDRTTALTAQTIASLPPSVQLGVAPESHLVSLKLSNTDGSSDVTQIIAALNWVTEHQTAPDGTRIRVVNLSFGTDSVQAYQSDPLAAAAENAWRHGLVVVVSGGNEGQAAGRLTDPAMDPYVLAVGASDPAETVAGWHQPTVASFSNSGTTVRHVDVLAPGASVVSLRDPGSYVDTDHPEGRVGGDVTGRLFRGSGTSQAAAVVSGAVALMEQANPAITPDQVKAILMRTARPIAGATAVTAGSGQIDVAAAVDAARTAAPPATASGNRTPSPSPADATAAQSYPVSTGQGSLDAARGGVAMLDADGTPLAGSVDAQGNPWNAAAWWSAASAGRSWSGGAWLGHTWSGKGYQSDLTGLSAARWSAGRWSAARWSAARWSDSSWTAARWSAARWSAARWSAARWSDANWG